MQVMTLHPNDAEPFHFGEGMRDAVPQDAVSLELMATVGLLDPDAHQR